jgi:hypothetical protein
LNSPNAKRFFILVSSGNRLNKRHIAIGTWFAQKSTGQYIKTTFYIEKCAVLT